MYASINEIGDFSYVTQFPDTDDAVVTEYAMKKRLALRYGVLWSLYVSNNASLSKFGPTQLQDFHNSRKCCSL